MYTRNVTDDGFRVWACTQDGGAEPVPGQDVQITCITSTVPGPVQLTIGWKWRTMTDKGLGRLITGKAPLPRRKASDN